MGSSAATKASVDKRSRKTNDAVRSSSYQSTANNSYGGMLDLQQSAGNQAVNRSLKLGSSGESYGEEEGLVVITDELSSLECTDFYMRDPEISDNRTGTLVHKALQNWMDVNGFGKRFEVALPTGSKGPLKEKSQKIGNRRQGPGYFDLAYKSEQLRTVEIAELKPANQEGFTDGVEELKWYLDKGNADEDLKRQEGISEFRPMEPWKFPLPLPLYVESRKFRLIWCMPGVILYKEIGKRKRERDRETAKGVRQAMPTKEERRQNGQANLKGHIESGILPNSRILVFSEAVSPEEASTYVWGREGYIDSSRGVPSSELSIGRFERFSFENLGFPLAVSMRPDLRYQYLNASFGQRSPMELPKWVPAELREAYSQKTIPQGLDTAKWKYDWPGGFSVPLLVNRRYEIVEVQALWPTKREFYELYAQKVGEGETFARRLHAVCTEWNVDMLSLLETSRREQNGYISISDARDQLREINAAIARLFATGFAIAFGSAAVGFGSAGLARPSVSNPLGMAGRMRVFGPSPSTPMGSGNAADRLIEMINVILKS